MFSLNSPEKLVVNGIPLLQFPPQAAVHSRSEQQYSPNPMGVPTLFIYHGWASCKENYHFIAQILSLYGCRVIVPDAPRHGSRAEERDLQSHFWDVIIQSVEEFPGLLQKVDAAWGCQADRSVVIGSSMGGFTAAGIFAQHADLAGLVSINASGAWEVSEQSFRRIEGRPEATHGELASIRRFDPLPQIPDLPIRPVLLQHGTADSIVPIDGQLVFHEALLRHYGERHRHFVTFEQVPRMNHYISTGMFESIISWLHNCNWLRTRV